MAQRVNRILTFRFHFEDSNGNTTQHVPSDVVQTIFNQMMDTVNPCTQGELSFSIDGLQYNGWWTATYQTDELGQMDQLTPLQVY